MTADDHLSAAIAELTRAKGLRVGPYTAGKRELFTQRLRIAGKELAKAYAAAFAQPPDPDPIPQRAQPPADSNVVAIGKPVDLDTVRQLTRLRRP